MPFDRNRKIVAAKPGRPKVTTLKRKRMPNKPKPTPKTNPLSTAISIVSMKSDGSGGNSVIVIFSRLLSEPEKTKIEAGITSHEAYEDLVTGLMWRSQETLRISIHRSAVRECGCRDVRTILREVVGQITT